MDTMNAPQVNIPLLRKQVETVEREAALPEEKRSWVQRSWITIRNTLGLEVIDENEHWQVAKVTKSCGTAGCLAGNTVLDAGYDTFIFEPACQCGGEACSKDENRVAQVVVDENGGRSMIRDKAAELLGLSYDEADRLFFPTNSAEDIRFIAEDIAGERL